MNGKARESGDGFLEDQEDQAVMLQERMIPRSGAWPFGENGGSQADSSCFPSWSNCAWCCTETRRALHRALGGPAGSSLG